LIAAQRAAGEALCATLKEQPKPSALFPALLAAKAALVALMQNTKSVAAAISIINLMAGLPSCWHAIPSREPVFTSLENALSPNDPLAFAFDHITKARPRRCREIGPVLA